MKRPWTGSQGFPACKVSPPLCSEHVTDDKGGHCDEGRHGRTDEGFHECHQTPCTYNNKTQECLNLIHVLLIMGTYYHIFKMILIGKEFLGSKSSHTTF